MRAAARWACGHACLTCPGRAHRDKLGLVRDVACCVTRSKPLGSPNDHRGRCLLSSAPCQPRLAAAAAAIPALGLRDLLSANLLPSMIVGSVVLVSINALIFGFVNWLPTFFVQQGFGVAKSLTYTLVIVSGSLVG